MPRRIQLLVSAAIATLLLVPGAVDALPPDQPVSVGLIGSFGTEAAQFRDPIDLDRAPDGSWFVSDYLNHRVQRLSATGEFLDVFGGSGSGAGQMSNPNGLDVFFDEAAAEHRLILADDGNDRLQVFELDGSHVQTASTFTGATPTSLNSPSGVDVAPDGRIAFGDRLNQRVLVVSPTFALIAEIELGAASPFGIAFSPDGDVLYVAASDNDIHRFDPETGAALGTIDLGALGIGAPYHIATDRIGFLYLANTNTNELMKISPSGREQWSVGGFGTAPGEMKGPYGVTAGDDGQLGVSEVSGDRLQVFDQCPSGFSDVPEDHQFWFEICWMATQNISSGFPDGSYQPSVAVSRQSMAAFLQRASGTNLPSGPPTPTFSDVPPGHPFYDEIEWMAAEGIAGGFDDGTFRPTLAVSRQAMSAFMVRAAGVDTWTVGAPSFSDVPAAHQFFEEIEWMAANGVTTGYDDGTYRPRQAVSRQAMSAFLARLALIT
jgi:streptogramin lyase